MKLCMTYFHVVLFILVDYTTVALCCHCSDWNSSSERIRSDVYNCKTLVIISFPLISRFMANLRPFFNENGIFQLLEGVDNALLA